jgi:alkylation response protein AidB-like acyl-CoA dehydrogenase
VLGIDTPELAAFRDRYRRWLAQHVPAGWRVRSGESVESNIELQRRWMRTLDTGGYAAPTWPVAHGGMSASLAQQLVMLEEEERADAPPTSVFSVSLSHAGSTIIAHGTEAHREHLVAIRQGERIFCQGFSEPNAGSDLASLQCRAVRDGGEYVVTGQKIWSSRADLADWGLLLVRTDPMAPKRRGISYLLVDLASPA